MNNKVKIKLATVDRVKEFIKTCTGFAEDIDYICGSCVVDAKSIMGVLSSDASKEACVRIHSEDENVIKRFENEMKPWIVEE